MDMTLQDKSQSPYQYHHHHPHQGYATQQQEQHARTASEYVNANNPYATSTRHEAFTLQSHDQRVEQPDGHGDASGRGGGAVGDRDGNGLDQEEVRQRDSIESDSTIVQQQQRKSPSHSQSRPLPAPEISPRRTRSKRLSLIKNLEQHSNTGSASPNVSISSSSNSNINSTPSSSRSSSRSRRTTAPTLILDTPPTSADPTSDPAFGLSKNNVHHSDASNIVLSSPYSIDANLASLSPTKGRINLDQHGDRGAFGGAAQSQSEQDWSSRFTFNSAQNSPTNTRYLDGNSSSVSSTPASSSINLQPTSYHGLMGNAANNNGSLSAPANILSFDRNNISTGNHSASSLHSSSLANHRLDSHSQYSNPSSSYPSLNTRSDASSSTMLFLSNSGNSESNSFNLSEQDEIIQKKINSKFVYKVYKMCCDESCQAMINWSDDGNSIQIVNLNDTSKEILSRHFKHSNFSSFIRQLNMYGFYKVNKTNRNANQAIGGKFSEGNVWEFSHPRFIRGRPDLLDGIKRRVPPEEVKPSSSNAQPSEESGPYSGSNEIERDRRTSAAFSKISDSNSYPNSESKTMSSSMGTGGGLGIGTSSSSEESLDPHPLENQSQQFHHQYQFPSSQSLPDFSLQNRPDLYSNPPSNVPRPPISISGASESPDFHQQQMSSFHQRPSGGIYSSDSMSALQRVQEQNYHLGQCVFQLRESLISLIDWIGNNGFNEGRLPFEIRIPTEQQVRSLMWPPEQADRGEALASQYDSGGLSAGILESQFSTSPQDINDGNPWPSNDRNSHHGNPPGRFNNHESDPSISSSAYYNPTRPEIFVTEPANLNHYPLGGLQNGDNRSSNASNWSIPSLASASSGSSRSGSGSGSFSNDPNRQLSHADTLTGGYPSSTASHSAGPHAEEIGTGMTGQSQNGAVNQPFSAPPTKTSFGDAGLPAGRNGLTINTSSSTFKDVDHSMGTIGTGTGAELGLNGIGLGFNPSILSAVNTPLPPSPATIQTPNSAVFSSNQYFLSGHNPGSLDSPVTPQTGHFIHAPGFGGTYFNPYQSMNSSHHRQSHPDPIHNPGYGTPSENDRLGFDSSSRSNSLDDVGGRLSKVMRTDNSGNTAGIVSSQSNPGLAIGLAGSGNRLDQRRSSLNHNAMLSTENPQQSSAPSSPGGIKRKTPT